MTWHAINSIGVESQQLRRGVFKTTQHPVIAIRDDGFESRGPYSRNDLWLRLKADGFPGVPKREDVSPETVFMPIETLTKLFG